MTPKKFFTLAIARHERGGEGREDTHNIGYRSTPLSMKKLLSLRFSSAWTRKQTAKFRRWSHSFDLPKNIFPTSFRLRRINQEHKRDAESAGHVTKFDVTSAITVQTVLRNRDYVFQPVSKFTTHAWTIADIEKSCRIW